MYRVQVSKFSLAPFSFEPRAKGRSARYLEKKYIYAFFLYKNSLKNFSKNFLKPLDKSYKVWYNKPVIKRKGEVVK